MRAPRLLNSVVKQILEDSRPFATIAAAYAEYDIDVVTVAMIKAGASTHRINNDYKWHMKRVKQQRIREEAIRFLEHEDALLDATKSMIERIRLNSQTKEKR